MKTLASYLAGRWHQADRDLQTLVNPASEEPLALVSSTGADFAGALDWARKVGGPALRELTFAQRGEILKALSKLREHRDELLLLSRMNNGTTASDGSFDVDGGGGALAVYGNLGLDDHRDVEMDLIDHTDSMISGGHGDRIGAGRAGIIISACPGADPPPAIRDGTAQVDRFAFNVLARRAAWRVGR